MSPNFSDHLTEQVVKVSAARAVDPGSIPARAMGIFLGPVIPVT